MSGQLDLSTKTIKVFKYAFDQTARDSIAAHLADLDNPHEVTAADVGLGAVDDTSDADKPLSDDAIAALALKAPLASPALTGTPTAPTASTGDVSTQIATAALAQAKVNVLAAVVTADEAALAAHSANTSNPHSVTKTQVGLGNADNTSDANKPVSTATQTALNALDSAIDTVAADLATHAARTDDPHNVTAAQVGLGSVNNTADADKPISTATQTALNALDAAIDTVAADLATHVANTSDPHNVTAAQVGLGNVTNTSDADKPVSTAQQTAINVVATAAAAVATDLAAHEADTNDPHNVTASQVGLGNVNNTADVDKPVSTATQLAINTLATTIAEHAVDNANPHDVTAEQIGLGQVDDTADLDKPVSTAAASALANKAPIVSPEFTGTPLAPTPAPGTVSRQLATAEFAKLGDLAGQVASRPGDALHLYGATKTGAAEDVETISEEWVAAGDAGGVIRVNSVTAGIDPVVIATAAAFPVESGRVYDFRWRVQRETDPLDPLNDAVRLGIRWLQADKSGVAGGSGTAVVANLALEESDGVVEQSVRVALSADDGIDVVAPAGTVYARPFVEIFGGSGTTDVIVIERADVTAIYDESMLTLSNYRGTWNANTNSPTIVSSTGTVGWWYWVATAGTTTINGISSWAVGDVIAFNGTVWQKVPITIPAASIATLLAAGIVKPDGTTISVDGAGLIAAILDIAGGVASYDRLADISVSLLADEIRLLDSTGWMKGRLPIDGDFRYLRRTDVSAAQSFHVSAETDELRLLDQGRWLKGVLPLAHDHRWLGRTLVDKTVSIRITPSGGVRLLDASGWIGWQAATTVETGVTDERMNVAHDDYGALKTLPLQNPERLDHFRACALGRLLGETGRTSIAILGDSVSRNNSWVSRFADRLKALYGDGGVGFVTFNWPPSGSEPVFPHAQEAIDVVMTGGDWVNESDGEPTLNTGKVTSSTAGNKFTVSGAPATPVLSGAVLYYVATGGEARYRWNGGSWTSITLSGSGSETASVATGMPGSGSWTFEIEVVSGSVSLVGVDFQSSSNGIVVHKLAVSGLGALHFGPQAQTAGWRAHWADLAPATTIVFLGPNDIRLHATVAQFEEDMQDILDGLAAAITDPDILLAFLCEQKDESFDYRMSELADVGRRLAYQQARTFLDLQSYFGTDPDVYGAGWADDYHPEDAPGGQIMAGAFLDAFRVG